ncbi:TIGR03826 family flagellar region protein [Alkaliphilus serpentinus]|uniref:MerR family transcriptional regulator n=1 Tax=Alkaliphilus serpentinus TaxID=1482731 RepID=A0A833M8N1_9FIRM|nr:TIGR03826 family flagellar region protein [Alkaliphilus serpentinus]KAB3526650.1 MerR family transcriptional regulator [Alkaliphilus serpentinus]
MDLRNCIKCGRVFSYRGSEICSRCGENDEESFKRVKEYLYDHPGATISEVSEATEVSEKLILKFLRDNRIEIRDESNFFLDCERCGKAIKSGRFCDSCAVELKRGFESVLPKAHEKKPEVKTSTTNRMFIAEMRKKQK